MTETDKRLITSAAGQNIDTGQSIERFIPFLAAELLNRIYEYHSGKPTRRFDLWNNCGQKMDKAHDRSGGQEDRFDYSTRLLEKKYTVLAELGIKKNDRIVVRDDSTDTLTWLKNKVTELYNSKAIYKDTATLNACNDCGYLISEKGAPVTICSSCGGSSFVETETEGLFLNMPINKQNLLEGKVYVPKNQLHLIGIMNTLPSRVLLNRVRKYGLSLDFIGFNGFVLDPKIGISLLPEMVGQEYGFNEVTQVQGIRTAIHTSPYTALLSPNQLNTYLFLYRIPPMNLDTAKDLGVNFISKYLPLFLLTKKGDIGKGEIEQLGHNYSHIDRKIKNTMKVLSKDQEGVQYLSNEDHEQMREVVSLFVNYNITQGLSQLRDFVFNTLSAKIANDLKLANAKLDYNDIESITRLLNIAY